MFNDFPWIKFVIVCIPFWLYVWVSATSFMWGFLFTIGVPIGVASALMGRSLRSGN